MKRKRVAVVVAAFLLLALLGFLVVRRFGPQYVYSDHYTDYKTFITYTCSPPIKLKKQKNFMDAYGQTHEASLPVNQAQADHSCLYVGPN